MPMSMWKTIRSEISDSIFQFSDLRFEISTAASRLYNLNTSCELYHDALPLFSTNRAAHVCSHFHSQ